MPVWMRFRQGDRAAPSFQFSSNYRAAKTTGWSYPLNKPQAGEKNIVRFIEDFGTVIKLKIRRRGLSAWYVVCGEAFRRERGGLGEA
jgi:hypothetical protein